MTGFLCELAQLVNIVVSKFRLLSFFAGCWSRICCTRLYNTVAFVSPSEEARMIGEKLCSAKTPTARVMKNFFIGVNEKE
jgi:hypothetical protein